MNCPLPSLDSTSCVARLEQEGDTGLKAVILFSVASPLTLLLRVAVAGSLASLEAGLGHLVVETSF